MTNTKEVISVRIGTDYINLMDLIIEFYSKYMNTPMRRGELLEWLILDGADTVSTWILTMTEKGEYSFVSKKGKIQKCIFNEEAKELAKAIHKTTMALPDNND